jgi:hypothetical protein
MQLVVQTAWDAALGLVDDITRRQLRDALWAGMRDTLASLQAGSRIVPVADPYRPLVLWDDLPRVEESPDGGRHWFPYAWPGLPLPSERLGQPMLVILPDRPPMVYGMDLADPPPGPDYSILHALTAPTAPDADPPAL